MWSLRAGGAGGEHLELSRYSDCQRGFVILKSVATLLLFQAPKTELDRVLRLSALAPIGLLPVTRSRPLAVDLEVRPSSLLDAVAVQLLMMRAARRDSGFVADLTAQGSRLGELEVVSVVQKLFADQQG